MFHCPKQKAMHPMVSILVTALSVAGAVSLLCLCKKKLACFARRVKNVGCDCAQSIEENFGCMEE